MSSCKEIVDLAFDYIKRELEPERIQRLEQHMQRCPSCINFIRTYECVPNLTREMLHERMPDALKEALRDYLRSELVSRCPSCEKEAKKPTEH